MNISIPRRLMNVIFKFPGFSKNDLIEMVVTDKNNSVIKYYKTKRKEGKVKFHICDGDYFVRFFYDKGENNIDLLGEYCVLANKIYSNN